MATMTHDPDPLTIWPETMTNDRVPTPGWAWLVTLGRAVLTAAILLGTLASSPARGADGPSAGTA